MSVFPAVSVLRIDTKKSLTEEGASEEDMVEGVLHEITPEFIDERLGGREKLIYTLSVKASSALGAKAKAKAFVRVKNPFEITNVEIIQTDVMDQAGILNEYRVTVGITKEGV